MFDANDPNVIKTKEIQQRAHAPTTSAWVSANAGSGKTFILTRRVIRLLIQQALGPQRICAPERIVCITFTKAAAAEMEQRLYKELSSWALASDADLHKEIGELGEVYSCAEDLARIRCLFAQALETPGGLKIQTIHSFCEQILRRFPIEAGLLPGFSVDDDRARRGQLDALALFIGGSIPVDEELSKARGILLRYYSDLDGMLRGLAPFLKQVGHVRRTAPDLDQTGWNVQLRSALGLPSEGESDTFMREAMARIDRPFLELMRDRHGQLGATFDRKAEASAIAVDTADQVRAFEILADAWLIKDWNRPKGLSGEKTAAKVIPSLPIKGREIIEILASTADMCAGYETYRSTVTMRAVAWVLYDQSEAFKRQFGILDFDDLVIHVGTLLNSVPGAWIMFKLDQGIDHILLDEAQDTSSPQWNVVEQFRTEFVHSAGDLNRPRTMFIVGDRKQSIYSFQGADAALFEKKKLEMKAEFDKKLAYTEEKLFLSFRSSPAILTVVDAMFIGEAGAGVGDREKIEHSAAKASLPGAVELWPLFRRPEKDDGDPWDLPVDTIGSADPKRQLAEAICDKISSWLSPKGRRRLGTDEPIRPSDILILCQNRKEQFYEIIRTLAARGIPSAGADRVRLHEDIAVQDLRSLLRFSCNALDDLSLAEALKSPLWAFTDEDLFALAHDRGETSLWAQMQRLREDDSALGARCFTAVTEINAAMKRGRQSGPFAFFSSFLEGGTPLGWARIRARLGGRSDEPLEELLSEALRFERGSPRSLSAFLHHFETLTTHIKKQSSEDDQGVRIMTVHGAKGLEAPIVFLADCTDQPDRVMDAAITLPTPQEPGGTLITKPSVRQRKVPTIGAAWDGAVSRNYDEYRRKLYVAATRAEEELYICGVERGSRKADRDNAVPDRDAAVASWYDLSLQAFARLSDVVELICPWAENAAILQYRFAGTASSVSLDNKTNSTFSEERPVWLDQSCGTESTINISFPSDNIHGEQSAFGAVMSPLVNRSATDPRRRGTLIHALLQLLPDMEPEKRYDAAQRVLAIRAQDIDPIIRHRWAEEALRVASDPLFADVFSPSAMAEVAVYGEIGGRRYSGQIDRMAINSNGIRIIEYKSHRSAPASATEIPSDMIGQVSIYAALLRQLYPDESITAAILWTHAPKLMVIPPEMLTP